MFDMVLFIFFSLCSCGLKTFTIIILTNGKDVSPWLFQGLSLCLIASHLNVFMPVECGDFDFIIFILHFCFRFFYRPKLDASTQHG